jgi:thiamine biosynthesis lipoprotein
VYRATTFRLIWLCAIVIAAGCERRQHLVEQHLLEFGTIIEITMISDDLLLAERLLAEIERRLKKQRIQWHAWEDSELTQFNLKLQRDARAEIPASLSDLLRLSREYHDSSGGLFNPALGKLIAAYGFHGGNIDTQAIARIRLDIPDMQDVQIDGDLASSRNPHLQFDFGGIAKGYAIGGIARFLDASGIANYVINAGGDLVVSGNRFGRPWRIGIQNPFAPGVIASIELEGRHALFTSGNYARSYRLGEELRHHIIDPRSGESARGQSSATVLGIDPVRADVAATALMIDGMRNYRELSQSLQVTNFLIVSDAREILLSRALSERVRMIAKWPVTIVD